MLRSGANREEYELSPVGLLRYGLRHRLETLTSGAEGAEVDEAKSYFVNGVDVPGRIRSSQSLEILEELATEIRDVGLQELSAAVDRARRGAKRGR